MKESKKLEEQKKIRQEIEQLENLGYSLPPAPTSARIWRWDSRGEIIDFNLTDCRTDLVFRVSNQQLYTLEECKILIKQVVKIMKRDAEADIKSLLFLSKFRTEMLFPKPIVRNYIQSSPLDGFPDEPDIKHMIYGDTHHSQGINITGEYPDNPLPMTEPRQKLEQLVLTVNKDLIKLIDNSLRQRKERLLLAATIIEELEGHSQLRMYFDSTSIVQQLKKK
jgi:hypothetical protein